MLTVVAPAAMAASTTWQRKSLSVREASSGENSTSPAVADGPLHAGHGAFDDFVLVHPQLVLAVDGAGGEEDVDAGPLGVADRLPGAVDVGLAAAGQSADDRAADVAGDFPHRLEIAGRGDGEARLDHVDAQLDQRLGEFHLFGQVHAGAGRLLAVAERGVEDHNMSRCGWVDGCHGVKLLKSRAWKAWLVFDAGLPTLGRPAQHQPRPRRAPATLRDLLGHVRHHEKHLGQQKNPKDRFGLGVRCSCQ